MNHSQYPRISQNRGGELKSCGFCANMNNGSLTDISQDGSGAVSRTAKEATVVSTLPARLNSSNLNKTNGGEE